MSKTRVSIKYIIMLPVLFSFGVLYQISLKNYLLPHTFMELTGAVVAMTIFCIGWNTREYTKNNFISVLAIGYLIVGILTVFHTLSYKGMGVFPEHGANIPTQFWIAARYVESITVLIAIYYLKNKRAKINSVLFLGLYLVLCTLIIISIFTGLFPVCFVKGVGLTRFKIVSEYIVCTILLYSSYALWKQREEFTKDIFNLILYSIFFTIISELSFTLYTDPYGFLNFIGHFFMIISIVLIYISLIKGNLSRPYQTLFKNVVDSAEELNRKNKELEIKDKAIASSLTAIALTDLKGCITYVNASFLKLLEYEEEEVLGQSVNDLIPSPIDCKKEEVPMNTRWYDELLLKKKDGSLLQGLITANFIKSKEGEQICGMVSLLDITERKKMEEELIRAKNDAVEANLAKSYFLANMSHEIRTPMNGILGFLQLLEYTSLDKKQMEYINNIKVSTDILLTVINDILDVSKIEAGKVELETIPFDLRLTIDNAIIPLITNAKEKELELKVLISPNVPRFIIGDPTRLKQVITNLVGNAIKFTPRGFVMLEVVLKETDGSNAILLFTVEDSGIGMTKEAMSKVFQPFTQAEASSNRRFGGTGLGLAICKSIVTMMGGNIEVESVKGKGSKFTFTIVVNEDATLKQNVETEYNISIG